MLHHDRNIKIIVSMIIVLVLIGYGDQKGQIAQTDHQSNEMTETENETVIEDSVTSLLGKTFDEILESLGEPFDSGFSTVYGPHDYLVYRCRDGEIRFCSPEGLHKHVAVSIIVTGQIKILGVRVGMTFSEIQEELGQSGLGPHLGMDDIYYMVYFFDGFADLGSYSVTFSASIFEGPTYEAFIKCESFDPMMSIEV